jgi:tetratricopeptide (TPR) repeat protein
MFWRMNALFATVLLGLSALSPVFAVANEELQFAEGLLTEGFPEFAQTVLGRALIANPELSAEAAPLEIRLLIHQRRFDETQARLGGGGAPDLWCMLAEGAYRARDFETAETAYIRFFSGTPEPNAIFLEAAMHYGELLENSGRAAEATALYERALEAEAGPMKRAAQARLARLLVEISPDEAALERALKLTEQVQLGGLDLWFGEAVVTWARIKMMQGKKDEAQDVLETQIELLYSLEENLSAQGLPASSISPLAGARFFLGDCCEQGGTDELRAKALHQFYNVYAKYGDSPWGPKAFARAEQLIRYFEEMGRTVNINPGANRQRMAQSAFRIALRLFIEKHYARAVEAYLDALNRYPETDDAVIALRELVQSYIHLGDDLFARAVAEYLSERFAEKSAAADGLLAAGRLCLDLERDELAWTFYELYLDRFPGHARAAGVLYSLAGLRRQAGDAAGEAAHLERILESYANSPYSIPARDRLAWNAFERKAYDEAARHFSAYLEVATDAEKRTRARFALGEAYRLAETWDEALRAYKMLEAKMAAAAEAYGVSAETIAFNKPFHEKALFYQAACFARLRETDSAVETYSRFIAAFPDSDLIEPALFAKGSVLMASGRYEEALAAWSGFDETSDRKFMEPVLYHRGKAFFETGRYAESVQSLETLLSRWPESGFFFEAKLMQGRACAAAGREAEAIRALSDVLNFAPDDLLMHRASLELGRAQSDVSEKLASFQRVALLADPADPEQAGLIEESLRESLPLYFQLERYADVVSDSDRYRLLFPDHMNEEIAGWRRQAEARLARRETEGSGS